MTAGTIPPEIIDELINSKHKLNDHILDNWFKYHSPTEQDTIKYNKINEMAKAFAKTILETCPECHDSQLAITLIRLSKMLANTSIACKDK